MTRVTSYPRRSRSRSVISSNGRSRTAIRLRCRRIGQRPFQQVRDRDSRGLEPGRERGARPAAAGLVEPDDDVPAAVVVKVGVELEEVRAAEMDVTDAFFARHLR
ncbi:hypothetical protein FHS41_000797 [Streptomyces violarus]|uniref:Uncharacterized protein n=1 Tax=Streptomyces violarus TaxID=67380 RepID=A0A7W5EZH5_9ACTN|nr:hypothetical protein [Streptomyces violarus]